MQPTHAASCVRQRKILWRTVGDPEKTAGDRSDEGGYRAFVSLGVQRVDDPHHPREYRELRSPGEMRILMNWKIVEQNGICAICHIEFTDY